MFDVRKKKGERNEKRETWGRGKMTTLMVAVPTAVLRFSTPIVSSSSPVVASIFNWYHLRTIGAATSTSTPLNFQLLSLRRPLSMASASHQSPQSVVATGDATTDFNVLQLIQSHEEKAARLSPVHEIRTVLANSVRGMLSTFSQKYEGYPSGSMVDFACDKDGSPILAISSLAFHTKDLLAHPRCSLLVTEDPDDKTDLVITLHGDAVSVSEEDREVARTAYLAKHPNAFWVDFGDFQFVRIQPKVVRYVSGIATALLGSGELTKEEYSDAEPDQIYPFSKPIASHMNKDHEDDTKLIVRHSTSIPVDSAYMLEVDSLGFNVKAGYQGSTYKLRIPFPRRAVDRKDVKALIIEMLQAAKSHGN